MKVQEALGDLVVVGMLCAIGLAARCGCGEARAARCVVSCYRDPPVCLYELRDAGEVCMPCREDAGYSCAPVVKNLGNWDPVPNIEAQRLRGGWL